MRNPEIESIDTKEELDEAEGKRRKIAVEEAREEKLDKKDENTESGYSETQQALDIEMRTGDLSAMKKSKAFQNLATSQKTLVLYETVSNKLSRLLETYAKLAVTDLHRAQKLLAEIAQLRILQSLLFNKVVGKTEEELDKSLLPEDLQEFV